MRFFALSLKCVKSEGINFSSSPRCGAGGQGGGGGGGGAVGSIGLREGEKWVEKVMVVDT